MSYTDILGRVYTQQELEDMECVSENIAFRSLDLAGSNIGRLPNNLKVQNDLNLLGATGLTRLPDGLAVGGDLVLDDSTVEVLPDGLHVGKNLWAGNSPVTRLPNNLKVGGTLDLCYEHWRLESIGTDIVVDTLNTNSVHFITNRIKCRNLYLTESNEEDFDCANIEVISYGYANPYADRVVIKNLHCPEFDLLLQKNCTAHIQNSKFDTMSVEPRVDDAYHSELNLFLTLSQVNASSISVLRRPFLSSLKINLGLSITDTQARLSLKEKSSPNAKIYFSSLVLQGDLAVALEASAGEVVLPDYGLVYGDVVCAFPLPKRFCVFGNLSTS